ncbi:hypothetical protein BJX70DRAFT_409484 [Aspergillus crustosus]
MPKAFLVTGTSTGFGHDLIQEVLNQGDIAIATARNPASLRIENATKENHLSLALDVTNTESIKAAFTQTIERFQRVDVVVNNAGYGLRAASKNTPTSKSEPRWNKWAVKGFTESIAKEMKPEWGIKLTCIEPGGFRTDWAGRSMAFTNRHPDHDHIDTKGSMMARNRTQPGDPKKTAKAFYQLAMMESPPLRILLGSDAFPAILARLEQEP